MRLMLFSIIGITFLAIGFLLIAPKTLAVNGVLDDMGDDIMSEKPNGYPVATLAGGCFWCIESEFRALNGVLYTRSGYIGGHTEQPTYQDITTGQTGHAEAIEITYDPDKISYAQLVEFFLTKAHDPTQINRQGVDVGTQYRSAIFYHDKGQKKIATEMINTVNAQKIYNKPIATQISPADRFWVAEDYHQQYYEKYEKERGEVHPRVFYKKQMQKLK